MPFIFIGAGGMGKETIARIKFETEKAKIENVLFLGLDIDKRYSVEKTRDIKLPTISVNEPARDISALMNNEDFLKWWPVGHNIYAPLSGSTGAGQIRINGKFALFMRADKIRKSISDVIKQAQDIAKNNSNDDKIVVFLISSMGGGTGSGMFVDLSFIIRSELGDSHRLYGVFYDGTITKSYETKTLDFSYAALSEIEYWMQNFKDYKMVFSGGDYVSGDNIGSKLFDITFLVQAETMDHKRFNSSGKAISPYIPMVVESLFSLISIPDFKTYIMANNWNRFDNLSNQGMQIRYGGFGVGTITYDEESVLSYVVNRLIKNVIFEADVDTTDNSENSFENDIEKPLQLSERTDQSLSNRVLHMCQNYSHIKNRIDSFKRKLIINNKTDEIKKLKSQFQLPMKVGDSYLEWEKLFSNYKEEIKTALYNKRLEFDKKLEDVIGRLIKNNYLNLSVLSDWLDTAIGVIEKNVDYINKYKEITKPEDTIGYIGKTLNILLKDKKLFGGLKVEYKSKFSNAVQEWVNSELYQIENFEIKEFFTHVNEKIEAWKIVTNIMVEKFGNVRRKIENEIGKYTSRDGAYNADSLLNKEFPLHIKLDINRDLIDRLIIDDKILGNKSIKDQLELAREIIFSGKGELSGIKDQFNVIHKEVFEGREKDIRAQEIIEEDLKKLLKTVIQDNISGLLYSIRIDDILEYWLKEQVYPNAKVLFEENNKQDLLRLKGQWRENFGDDGAEALLSEQYFDDSEKMSEWFEIALKHFIMNFKSKIFPFVRYNNQIKKNYWEKTNLGNDLTGAFKDRVRLFVPENFKFSYIFNDAEDEVKEIKSSHNKIKVFAETYAFPLHALDLVTDAQEHRVRETYLKHRDNLKKDIERDKLNSQILHVDKRFYTKWRIDIGSDEVDDIQGYWLYIISLGIGFIIRDNKKKFVLRINDKSKTISTTFPKTLEKIRTDDKLRETLQRSVKERVNEIYYNSDKDFSKIEEIFKNAHKIHLKFEPVKTKATKEAFDKWEEIEETIRVLSSGSFADSSKVPKDWGKMEILLDIF